MVETWQIICKVIFLCVSVNKVSTVICLILRVISEICYPCFLHLNGNIQ